MNGYLTPRAVRLVSAYDDGEDARHFTFEPVKPVPAIPAEPGQFFMLTLPGKGEAPFTYTSVPDADGRFSAVVRRVGLLTRELFELKAGAVLGCRGPYGHGWPTEEIRGQRVLVISGGCGLAPLAGAISHFAKDGTPIAVIYGARTPASQVLARERASWTNRVPLFETFDTPAPGETRIGTPLIAIEDAVSALGGEPAAVLTCGPEAMMNPVAEAMVKRGVPAGRIWLSLERRMHCGVGLCGHCYVAHSYACKQGPTYRWDELQMLRERAPSWPSHTREVRHC